MRESKYEKELRIGLVLYGGVSLAIYIYGVVFEFLRLVREEGAYAKLTQKTRLKPVIDIISGSSAGGINGLFLAKALTTGADLAPLKELWIQKGDLEALVNAESKTPLSLLDSGYYEQLLREALTQMKPDSSKTAAKRTTNLLDLFITATNLDGIVTEYGKPFFRSPIQTKHYSTVFRFKARPGNYDLYDHLQLYDNQKELSAEMKTYLESMVYMLTANRTALNDLNTTTAETAPQSGRDKNYYLARIAAATSAFPVAFQPVPFKKEDIAALKHHFGADIFGDDFSSLGISQEEATQAVIYGDGGMVNNKPFRHTIRTIFNRQADGPVDRKLFFIEPDPEAFSKTNRLGDKEGVDGLSSLQSFFEAIFYESISTDLQTLVEQNQRILNVRQILLDFEAQLALYLKTYADHHTSSPTQESNRQMYQNQPVYATYRQLKIISIQTELENRMLAKVDMDQWLGALGNNPPEGFSQKSRAEQEIYLQNLLKEQFAALMAEQYNSLKTEDDTSAFLQRFDAHFRIRRLRYFINKINQWLLELDLLPGVDQNSAEVSQVRKMLGTLKGKIYVFIEFYNHGVWQVWDQARPIKKEDDLSRTLENVSSGYDKIMESGYKHLAFEMVGDDLAQAVQQLQRLRPPQPYPPGYEEYYQVQKTTAYLENMLVNCAEDNFTACMEQVFNTYEFLDMYLYPATLLANIGEADPVEVIRVSPKDAVRYRDTVQDKLAGEKLVHFSAFLKRSWRENDLLWGRLDAAEIIVKTLLPHDEAAANEILAELCPAIIKEELISIRERRGVEINQGIFNDNEQTLLKSILDEYTTLKEAKDTESYLKEYYTTGLEGFEAIAQDYLLRTSAKSLRTISRLFEQRSAGGSASPLSLNKPLQYLTPLFNLPYIFLITLGGAEENRRKQLLNFVFIIGVVLLVLNLIGGLVLQGWLLLVILIFLLFYLRPSRIIATLIVIVALLIVLFTTGVIDIDICFQNPLSGTQGCWL